MLLNTNKLKSVLTELSYLNNIKSLGIDEFKELNLYYKDNNIYLIFVGNFLDMNTIKMIYRFEYSAVGLEEGLYTIILKDMLKVLKYFGESVDFKLQKEHLFLDNPQDISQNIVLNVIPNNNYVEEFIARLFSAENIQSKVNSYENPIIEEDINRIDIQLKYRNIDKSDNSSHINFLPQKMSVQQFNYTTISNLDLGFTGRLPTPFIRLINSLYKIEPVSIKRTENNVEIFSENMYGIIDNVDDFYHSVDRFVFTESNSITLNKQDIISNLNLIKDFCKNNEGYLKVTDSGIVLSNVSNVEDNLEDYTVKSSKNISVEHTNPYKLVFGFDINIMLGIISILSDNEFKLVIEQDTEDSDTYLCYIVDSLNKNILSLDVYS